MRKLTALVVALIMVFAFVPMSVFADDIEYIEIRTASQLADIGNNASNLSKNYKLVNDIDLSSYNSSWNSASGGWWVIGWFDEDVAFTGVFDGNGHKITGLTHDETGGVDAGLFAINKGSIMNLTIDGANIRSGASLGAICGTNYGIISNCHVSNSTIAAAAVVESPFDFTWFGSTFKGSLVGGICGINYGQIIYSTVSNSNITWNNTDAKHYTGPYVGGICGAAGYEEALVGQCYVVKSYIGHENASKEGSLFHVGGAVGCMASAKGMTDVAVAESTISGLQFVGGLVGTLNYTSAVNSASWFNSLKYLDSEYYPVADPCCPQLPPTGSAVINLYFAASSDYADDGSGIIGISKERVLSGDVIGYEDWSLESEYWYYQAGTYPLPRLLRQMTNSHKVTFIDGVTGEEFASQEVEDGASVDEPVPPVHEGYRFIGWDRELNDIAKDTVITALYVKVYTVTFVDGLTGETIEAVEVDEGDIAKAPAAPYHEGYKFVGWDKSYTNVQEDMTVTALYEPSGEYHVYSITFVDGLTGEVIETLISYGGPLVAPEPPYHEGYRFIGWDKDFSVVTSDMVITALYEKIEEIEEYEVTFVDGLAGEVIAVQRVESGMAATAPEVPYHDGYEFRGWDKDFSVVTSDMTVTAIYEKIDVENIVRGDADENGEVESADATKVLRYVAKLETLEGTAFKNADADENGDVDSADATSILRFVAKLGW